MISMTNLGGNRMGKWVKIDEAIPSGKKGTSILIANNQSVHEYVFEDNNFPGYLIEKITHWQPMIKPPKENE